MIILGIDPGLRTTGFGVIEKHGNKLRYIASGTVKTGSEGELPPRLKIILRGVSEIVGTYQPDCAAIEKCLSTSIPNRPCCWARRAARPFARWSTPTCRWPNIRRCK